MTKQEAFAKIKKLLFSEEKQFENTKLIDGETILQWEGELADGVAISVVDSDGNLTPAPDGTHETVDGFLVSTVGGLVTKIEKKEAEEVENEEEMYSKIAEFIEQFVAFKSEFDSLKTEVATYKEQFELLSKTDTEIETKFKTMKEIVEDIASQPSVEVEAPKNTTFSKVEKSRAERLKDFITTK
jgi:hypothetical protein